MADSLNPLNDEHFTEVSAAARADADEALEGDAAPQDQIEVIGRNGYHAFSGPLSPLGAPSTLKEGGSGPQGRRHKLLPIILAIIGVVVILSCLGMGTALTVNLLSVQSGLNSPQATLDGFYSALHIQDYQTAYNQLSSSYQKRISQSSFRAAFELMGTIDSYQIGSIQTQNNLASGTVQVTLDTPGGGTVHETKSVQLIQENGVWKINNISPGLSRAIWLVGQRLLTLDWG